MTVWLHVMTSCLPFETQRSAKAQTLPMELGEFRSVQYLIRNSSYSAQRQALMDPSNASATVSMPRPASKDNAAYRLGERYPLFDPLHIRIVLIGYALVAP